MIAAGTRRREQREGDTLFSKRFDLNFGNERERTRGKREGAEGREEEVFKNDNVRHNNTYQFSNARGVRGGFAAATIYTG